MLSSALFAQMGGMGGMGMGNNPFLKGDLKSDDTASTGWRPWLTANGNYVKPLGVRQQVTDYLTATAGASGGIGGYKRWGFKRIAGGYTGMVSYNPQSSGSLGKWRPSQSANLSYAQQLSQRLSFSVQQLGGVTYGGYGFSSGFGIGGVPGLSSSYGAGGSVYGAGAGDSGFGDPTINGFVDNEIFGGRVKFYGGNASVNYLLSQRLSVSAYGGAYIVRRDQGIQSTNSYSGGSQIEYQLDGRNGIGAGVTLSETRYPNYFGAVRGMTYFGSFSHQFNPTMRIALQGGVAHMASEFIGQVALPPEVAALVGSGTSLAVQATDYWTPTAGVTFSKAFQIGAFSLNASRGIGMGNGVVLAGMRDLVAIGFHRSITPKIGANLVAGYSRASGRVGILRITDTVQSGGLLSYRLVGGLSVSAQGGFRYVGVQNQTRRSELFVGGGINWTPGNLAITF